MLILPLHRKPGRENFPVVTILLVLANLVVFALFQSGDGRVEQEAAQNYIDSGVLEHEWGWFAEWADLIARRGNEHEQIDLWFGEVGEDDQGDQWRLMMIESEPAFLQAVEDGVMVPLDTAQYRQWRNARDQLELDRSRSFTRNYMLRYDEINPINALTHMFMHGGIGHLIGNMVFLVLLGLLIEGALGGGRFLTLYLVSGLGAVVASLSLKWGADTGGIGASGAIAGLMGLFAVIYGMRKVRFFYWAFVYFDYVRAPALILLPMWLGWELLAYSIDDGSNIAYEAHIGGIVAGALLGLLAVRTGQVRKEFLDADNGDDLDNDRAAIAEARQALGNLDAPTAKRLLRPLLTRHRDETGLWRLYFAACRLRLDDPELHTIAGRILRLPGDSPEQRELIIDIFAQYRQASKDRLKLKLSAALELARKLVAWGELEPARFLVDRMLRAPQPVPGLAELCQALAERLELENPATAGHYRHLAQSMS